MIFINPHKCCTFVTEKSCLTSNANLCIIQKLKLLPSHYLYWGETLVNRSFLAIRHILAEFSGKSPLSDGLEDRAGKNAFSSVLRVVLSSPAFSYFCIFSLLLVCKAFRTSPFFVFTSEIFPDLSCILLVLAQLWVDTDFGEYVWIAFSLPVRGCRGCRICPEAGRLYV